MKASRRAGVPLGLVLALALAVPAAAQQVDRSQVVKHMNAAWHDRFRCMPVDFCSSYFDSFGVAIVFADGTASPFEHEQRGETAGHNCIKLAKSYLAKGDRGRAVQWAIASQTSVYVRDWMREHPDEVLELLRGCC